jgi:hypothetical protein
LRQEVDREAGRAQRQAVYTGKQARWRGRKEVDREAGS